MQRSRRSQVTPQTRFTFMISLLLRGVLYGLGASALATLFAYFVTRKGWDGTASDLNIAGTILWILGGSFMWGAFTAHGREVGYRARVGRRRPNFPGPSRTPCWP